VKAKKKKPPFKAVDAWAIYDSHAVQILGIYFDVASATDDAEEYGWSVHPCRIVPRKSKRRARK
jgi:hypothetical protein